MDDIKELNAIEESIYDKLNKNTLSNEETERNIGHLTTISNVRNSLSHQVLDKSNTLGIMKREEEHTISDINALKTAKDNKRRMVEINTYYGKQYSAHTSIVVLLLYTLVPIFVLAFLRKRGLINANITSILVAIIMVIGTVVIYFRVSDISSRNNIDYDKYEWPGISGDGTKLKDYIPPPSPVGGESNDGENCVGGNCCGSGTIYSKSYNKCIPSESMNDDVNDVANHAATSNESFTLISRHSDGKVTPFSESINCARV